MFGAWWRRLWNRRDVSLGRRGEDAAAEHLERLGYRILERGRRFRFGELDLVALDGRTLVFVEVKTRSSADYGSPSQAVDARKRRRMTNAALGYLKQHRLLDRPSRFDVVSIVWPPDGTAARITHHRSAFEAAGRRGFFS
jgi:putative endonuclease